MKLLVIESNLRAYPAPEIAEIKEFRDLIARDRGSKGDSQGRSKQKATRELAYVFHMHSPESPYVGWAPEVREEKVVQALFPPDWEWKKDALVEAAEKKFIELTETELVRMLRSARLAVNKITDYLDGVTFVYEEGGPEPSDIGEVMKVFKDLKGVVDTLEDLQDRVAKQLGQGSRLKGGVKVNEFSR